MQKVRMRKRIVIIGAGPTGLGAAYRLSQLKYKDWDIYEKNPYVGGLSASFRDRCGFTWDIGGHVIFSHFSLFTKIVDNVLKKDFYKHLRKSYIFTKGRWVPYPFQNNIRYLEPHRMLECLSGLLKTDTIKNKNSKNFEEWIYNTFGDGIAKYFMIPHNRKLWLYPLNKMSYNWIKDRISITDVNRILRNVIQCRDDVSWGPNYTFKFPTKSGTGEIFKRIGQILNKRPCLNKEASHIDLKNKIVIFKDRTKTNYDYLINTSRLDKFLKGILRIENRELLDATEQLKHTNAFIVGIGFKGSKKTDRCWVYFPDKNISFYRLTYFTNYSPYNAPRKNTYSILCEVAANSLRGDCGDIANRVIRDLIYARIIEPRQRRNIISKYVMKINGTYPIPTIDRDKALHILQPFLHSHSIYSRGRFGTWKYETGNMDHCFMQGVEAIDNILFSKKERVFN